MHWGYEDLMDLPVYVYDVLIEWVNKQTPD
jgi:hypothetical protein